MTDHTETKRPGARLLFILVILAPATLLVLLSQQARAVRIAEVADAEPLPGSAQVVPGGFASLDSITDSLSIANDVDLDAIQASGGTFSATTGAAEATTSPPTS